MDSQEYSPGNVNRVQAKYSCSVTAVAAADRIIIIFGKYRRYLREWQMQLVAEKMFTLEKQRGGVRGIARL
ncbi:MAG: hypothetical protein C0600_01430 [Ignavibacteria bacterium]|nr:MAG: hypothetical protein C0600_01430 [Ignavibacteria bacterium]